MSFNTITVEICLLLAALQRFKAVQNLIHLLQIYPSLPPDQNGAKNRGMVYLISSTPSKRGLGDHPLLLLLLLNYLQWFCPRVGGRGREETSLFCSKDLSFFFQLSKTRIALERVVEKTAH